MTLSSFQGKDYIHIREYYAEATSGLMKPGKKGIAVVLCRPNAIDILLGIALTVDQFHVLSRIIPVIKNLLK